MAARRRPLSRTHAIVAASAAAWAGQLVVDAGHPGAVFEARHGYEAAGWALAAAVLTRLPSGWKGSAAWPSVLLLAVGLERALAAAGTARLPLALAGAGIAVVAVVLVRVLEDLVAKLPVAAPGLAVGAALGARWFGLVEVGARPAQLVRELTSPWLLVAVVVLGALAARGRAGAWVGLVGAAAVGPIAFRHPPLVATADRAPVVIISIDTLRADHADRMRSVARLADRGAWWPRASSVASWTLPSLASLQTGLLPAHHGAGVLPGPRPVPIDAEVPLLAERMGAAGYTTGCFVVNPFASAQLGFARGCDAFLNLDDAPPFALTFTGAGPVAHPVEAATRWIARAPDRGAFLWVHLIEPHLPYEHLPTDPDDALSRALDGRTDLLRATPVRAGMVSLDGAAWDSIRAAYQREVDDADARVESLLDAVDARWPDAIVVLTADHGEEFLDHGGFEHGHSHHGEVVDIPLLIAGAGLPAGRREDQASLVDVVPTVLAAVGLPAEGSDGEDLHVIQPPDRVVTLDGNLYAGHSVSARQVSRRAIVGVGEFDLAADPGEHAPQPPGPLTVAAEQAAGPGTTGGEAASVSTEGLKALGYLE